MYNLNELKRTVSIGIVVVAGMLLCLGPLNPLAFAQPLRIGVFPNLHCALIYLADSQGFFKKHGIQVAIKEYESGPTAVNDLMTDKIDMVPPSQFVFVLHAFRHPDLRILATICISSDNELVVRKDRGIAGPRDLHGKRIAVTRDSSGDFFLNNYLIFNRIPAPSIRIVYLEPSEMVKAMAEGALDAALSWPPFTTRMAEQLGTKGALWPAHSGQDDYNALLAKEGLLKKQPKVMEQFLAVLLEAERFIEKYPDRAQDFLRRRFPESFLQTWPHLRFQLQLSQDMLVLMEREAKWAIRNKLVEKQEMPNYLDFLYFDALEKVKKEAVSIVH